MPAPLYWKSKILLAKIETTYGTDSAPTGALNAILATEVKIQPMEGSDVSRDLELPYLGGQGTIPNELHAKLTFRVELAPSGTAGTAPGWGVLLRACGVAQVINAATSVVYNPISANHESATIHLWIDTTRYVIRGTRGTAKIMVSAQGIPYIEYSFTGLFAAPAETVRPSPVTLTAFQKPQVGTSTNTPVFTINAVAFVMRSFTLDLKNAVEPRFLIGAEQILITQREEEVETVVEAQPLTAFNPFTLAQNQTSVPVVLTHGTGAGKISTLNMPAAQVQRLQGLESAQDIKEWPLRLAPLPVAGNDQWTLTLT
ncbi:phage tail tube protein [Tabrizicola sp.]|uniref:phage tail tube protein n=1 Tax=Tabrizicola sp. TaxID=2005166 RepID=UPI0025D8EB5A|nr:phage tail tube protein [Tabrizicola sp.]